MSVFQVHKNKLKQLLEIDFEDLPKKEKRLKTLKRKLIELTDRLEEHNGRYFSAPGIPKLPKLPAAHTSEEVDIEDKKNKRWPTIDDHLKSLKNNPGFGADRLHLAIDLLKDEIKYISLDIESIKNFSKINEYIFNTNEVLFKQSRDNITTNEQQKGIMKFIDIKGSSSSEYMNEYLRSIGDSHTIKVFYDDKNCDKCNCKMIVNKQESSLSCVNCGNSFWFFDPETVQWSDSAEIVVQFVYERISHFKDHLKQLQGKHHSPVPQETLNDILKEIEKTRLTEDKITKEKVIHILKKLNKSRYYKNANFIIYKLTGKKPPQLPRTLEERLIHLFKVLQIPFEIHKPPDRKNFFSYSYIIHKLLTIISYKEPEIKQYIKFFPLLKSRDKLIIQEEIMKKCCASLNWDFVPCV